MLSRDGLAGLKSIETLSQEKARKNNNKKKWDEKYQIVPVEVIPRHGTGPHPPRRGTEGTWAYSQSSSSILAQDSTHAASASKLLIKLLGSLQS